MTAPMYAKDCGVCHVGGGQLEYDLNMKEYGTTGTGDDDTGSTFIYQSPFVDELGVAHAGGIVATSDADYPQLLGDNKAEVDCMMCHANALATGAAWYKSMGCDGVNMPGPADNLNCNGYYDLPFQPGVDGTTPDSRFNYTPGTIYDSYNRNISVSIGFFKQSASAGIGALINLNDGTLSNVPAEIPGTSIASVPNSANCAMCHARTSTDNIGLPMEAGSYGGMLTGYGNFFRMTPGSTLTPGEALDWDKIAADGTCTSDCGNTTLWNEFGCKTGMGKRAQRAGVGDQDRFGFGICLGCATFNAMMGDQVTGWFGGGVCAMPSVQTMCNDKAGTTLQGGAGQWMGIFDMSSCGPGGCSKNAKIVGKLEDTDVHDKAGVKCATCHYNVSGEFPARTIGSGSDIYTYPSLTDSAGTSLQKMDHQIAQGWSTMEKANEVLDGTVTCEGCHIDGNHPNKNAIAGHSAPDAAAVAAAHAGFPAIHFEKIDCRTCHIPEVYAAPGRLLFRDWTAGAYRQTEGSNGNANHFQFMYNFMDGAATPIRPLKQWIKVQKNGADVEYKIGPGLSSMLPMWYGNSGDQPTVYQPIMTRDVTASAALVAANNPGFGIRMNGTNEHPPFQGFQLADPLKIESSAKITAMRSQLATTGAGLATHNAYPDTKLNLQPYFFDPSHGVVEKELALGATARGGCVNCHSSSDASSPNYSSKSVGFFDGSQEMLKNGMMQMADYDCGGADGETSFALAPGNMCGMFNQAAYGGNNDTTCDANELTACKVYIGTQLFPMFGMPADIAGTIDETGFHAGAFPIDGIDMMQLMAVREGSSMAGCDPRFKFFGMSDGTGPGTTGCVMGNYFSRDEIRAHFKKNLQQVQASGANKVFGNIKVGPTQSSYDLGTMCKTFGPDGMPNGEALCTNGGYINTVITEQKLLGYTSSHQAALTNLNNCAACHSVTMTPMNHPAGAGTPTACSSCHTTQHQSALSVDVACGQCHGGSGIETPGVPYYSVAELAIFAKNMHNSTPVPQFSVTYGPASKVVNFTAVTTDSACPSGTCTYDWAYGDATTGTGATSSHLYSTTATSSVTLTVNDSTNHSSASITKPVMPRNFAPAPPATYIVSGTAFRLDGITPVAGASVRLTRTLPATPAVKYATGTIANGTFSFANVQDGTYTIQVIKGGLTFSVFSAQPVVVDGENVSGITASANR